MCFKTDFMIEINNTCNNYAMITFYYSGLQIQIEIFVNVEI